MDEFERGKSIAELVNKYKFTLIDKVRIVLYITLIPVYYFIFYENNTNTTLLFFLGIYISFVSLIFIAFEITKFYYIQRREKDSLRNLIRQPLDRLLLMIPYFIFDFIFDPIFGSFSSKEFRQGFRDTYWATKFYYLFYIVALLIFIPF